MSNIYCSVNTCHYWDKGNICAANEIMITSDTLAAERPDSLDAPKHAQFPTTPVNDCMATCCKTFVRKGSGDERLDGVKKTTT